MRKRRYFMWLGDGLIPVLFLLGGCGLLAGESAVRLGQGPAPRLHALLINGGGNQRINYQSHLLHLKQLNRLLLASGVEPQHISIFSSDGEDAGPDVALRELQPEQNFWRLRGTRAFESLRMPLRYESSSIAGASLRPATQAELSAWFESASSALEPGDTLLVYVTDHGNKNAEDLTDNTIVLWGEDESLDESLSVNELRELLAKLDPGVRVVMLMSQCFSGSFANLIDETPDQRRPSGRVCGYFSCTAARRAYGCYAQNRGRENIGHSFRFIQALAASGSFPAAHADVLSSDVTPDVPLRSSDFYVQRLLQAAADAAGVDYEDLVDELLSQAWLDKGAWEPDIRLIDRVANAFGYFSPRLLAELDEQTRRLPGISGQIKNVSRAWRSSLLDASRANFDRFVAANPQWNARIGSPAAAATEADKRDALAAEQTPGKPAASARELTAELLDELIAFTRAEPNSEDRIVTLHDSAEATAATSYRMESRLGVVLRMRALLTSIAGRVYLDKRASREERAGYAALRQCEDLRIPQVPELARVLEQPEAFPAFKDDADAATAALPAWLGIKFGEVEDTLRDKLGLGRGAARVLAVYPDSPAEGAGLQSGDIIVGAPGQPFAETRMVRSWTMLSPIGESRLLDIIRDEEPMQVNVLMGRYPVKWPELAGPPEIGSQAPKLELASYHGDPQSVVSKGPYLLYFWATWCRPCKAALPELLEFEKAAGVPVIAITDEVAEQLDAFFENAADFPANVAIDRYRRSFLAYGVSATPTFVLVDGEGKIRSQSSGYSEKRGLGAEVRALLSENGGRE